MQGVPDHFCNRASFDDLAGIHHADLIGEPGDNREIVGDPYQGRAALTNQLLHLEEDLGLNRDVECGGRFVSDDEIRLVKKRDCYDHALAHPA